jgi:hypothetical protein
VLKVRVREVACDNFQVRTIKQFGVDRKDRGVVLYHRYNALESFLETAGFQGVGEECRTVFKQAFVDDEVLLIPSVRAN